MLSFIAGLFGGSSSSEKALEIADKSLSGIGGWINNMSYTEQEKAADIGKAVENHLALVSMINSENSIRSVTRRWIAFSICAFVLVWGFICMGLVMLGLNEKVRDLISVFEALNMGWAFITVIGLYFGVQFKPNRK